MVFSVLLTRPQPGAENFAAQLRASFGETIEIVQSPVMQIEDLEHAPLDLNAYCGIVLTSAHAVPAVAAENVGHNVRCFCVGEATAAAAREAGLIAENGGGTAAQLISYLVDQATPGLLLYVRGRYVSMDLAATLKAEGIETKEVVVYSQNACPLNQHAKSLLNADHPVAVPLFSARSAQIFFEQAEITAPLWPIAISAQVSKQVPQNLADKLVICETPTSHSMLSALKSLEERIKRVERGYRPK